MKNNSDNNEKQLKENNDSLVIPTPDKVIYYDAVKKDIDAIIDKLQQRKKKIEIEINSRLQKINEKDFIKNARERLESVNIYFSRMPGEKLLEIITAILFVFSILGIIHIYIGKNYSIITAGISAGIIAAALDYIIEFKGICKDEWDYPFKHFKVKGVPMIIPLFSFLAGICIAYVFFLINFRTGDFMEDKWIPYTQIILGVFGLRECLLYFSGNKKVKLIWGLLPLSLAFWLLTLEPWIIIISIIPMYADYFFETKYLVKRYGITYEGYDANAAVVIAMAYFAISVIMLSLVSKIYEMLP